MGYSYSQMHFKKLILLPFFFIFLTFLKTPENASRSWINTGFSDIYVLEKDKNCK